MSYSCPCTVARQTSLTFIISRSLLKLMSISCSIVPFSSCLQCFQHQGLLQWVHCLHQVARVLELQPQHQSFQWIYSGLLSFRIDWFDLLAVQENLKSLQHHSLKASILCYLTFFYSPTLTSIHDYWKSRNFDYAYFVGKVMFLLFNMLSRFVIVFLLRNKHLLISWLQSPYTLIWNPRKQSLSLFPLFPHLCALK